MPFLTFTQSSKPKSKNRVKKTVFLLIFLLPIVIHAQNAEAILGTWLVQKRDAKIEIYEKDNAFFGKIIWLEKPTDDRGNPVKNEKGEEFMGMVIMKGFVFDDGEWVDGSVYDAEEGKTYHGSVELLKDGRLPD